MECKAKGFVCACCAMVVLVGGCGGPRGQDDATVRASLQQLSTPVLENEYPFVLLPGFFGWGRDELFGWKHFGGFNDIQQDLCDHGYETYTVATGPISSSWDRAAEMYAQLVGGRVDYGVAHANKHRHARFGRTYEGLLPLLGTYDTQGRMRKVNVIAHSMGAQTVRVLVALLADGNDAERDACLGGICPADDGGEIVALSPLFAGTAGQWVHSIGSISGANDGSTAAHVIQNRLDLNEFITAIVKVLNFVGADILYDFKLDQFGLGGRMDGESPLKYANRMVHSLIEKESQDTSFYDLSLDGAAKINGWTPAEPDVFYFSWTNSTSYPGYLSGHHYPVSKTNMLLRPVVTLMGRYAFGEPSPSTADSTWWENDGIVNTISMDGPKLNSSDEIVFYDTGDPKPGVWNVMGNLKGWDHWDTLGLMDTNRPASEVLTFYRTVAATLRGESSVRLLGLDREDFKLGVILRARLKGAPAVVGEPTGGSVLYEDEGMNVVHRPQWKGTQDVGAKRRGTAGLYVG